MYLVSSTYFLLWSGMTGKIHLTPGAVVLASNLWRAWQMLPSHLLYKDGGVRLVFSLLKYAGRCQSCQEAIFLYQQNTHPPGWMRDKGKHQAAPGRAQPTKLVYRVALGGPVISQMLLSVQPAAFLSVQLLGYFEVA